MPLATQADVPTHLTKDNLEFDIKVYNQEILETLQGGPLGVPLATTEITNGMMLRDALQHLNFSHPGITHDFLILFSEAKFSTYGWTLGTGLLTVYGYKSPDGHHDYITYEIPCVREVNGVLKPMTFIMTVRPGYPEPGNMVVNMGSAIAETYKQEFYSSEAVPFHLVTEKTEAILPKQYGIENTGRVPEMVNLAAQGTLRSTFHGTEGGVDIFGYRYDGNFARLLQETLKPALRDQKMISFRKDQFGNRLLDIGVKSGGLITFQIIGENSYTLQTVKGVQDQPDAFQRNDGSSGKNTTSQPSKRGPTGYGFVTPEIAQPQATVENFAILNNARGFTVNLWNQYDIEVTRVGGSLKDFFLQLIAQNQQTGKENLLLRKLAEQLSIQIGPFWEAQQSQFNVSENRPISFYSLDGEAYISGFTENGAPLLLKISYGNVINGGISISQVN